MSAALSFEPDEPPGPRLPGEHDGDGWDDTMVPGPLLAMVLGVVAGDDGEGLAAVR